MSWWSKLVNRIRSKSSTVGRTKGVGGGKPVLVHKERDGLMVLVRGSLVDKMSSYMSSTGGGLSTKANVAMLAGRLSGIGTKQGLLLYKSGDATVKKLKSGKDALSGTGAADWDEPCYLVMFRVA